MEERLARVVSSIEGTRIGRWLDRWGSLSPLATLRTFTPGARELLRSAEREAERGLHVGRGVLFITVFAVAVGPAGLPALVPWWVPPLIASIGVVLWLGIWLAISRPSPSPLLPFGLILFDCVFTVRAALLANTPLMEFVRARGFSTEVLTAPIAPLLVVIAATGGFRLNPLIAAFATLCALSSYVVAATLLGRSGAVVIAEATIIWFAGALGAQVARVFRHTMVKAREQEVLERYVPRALTQEIARTGMASSAGREIDITVLIVDIRGYTLRSERMTPAETVRFLNDYFAVVVSPLAAQGAVLDKYIGDGVFTFLEGPEHERRGLCAARDILAALDRYNESRPDEEPIRIGIALHSGRAVVGTIGSEHKREYTAIADVVNVAARLEELNKRFDAEIIASSSLVAAAGGPVIEGLVGPTTTEIRGHGAAIDVHYLPRRRVYTGAESRFEG